MNLNFFGFNKRNFGEGTTQIIVVCAVTPERLCKEKFS